MKEIIRDIRFEIQHMDRSPASARRFGFILTTILLLIAGWLWYKERDVWMYWAAPGVLVGLISAIAPNLIYPLYTGATIFSIFIGYFVSRVILLIMFTLFFVPVGLITRLFGRDLLKKRIDLKATTYWTKKESPVKIPEHYERMF
ncbi:MAG TPA: SxtJ family membrane protein [bacterium]|nr:SxtJ family membrane protein [bacterium]